MNALQTIENARGRGVMIYSSPNLETPKTYKAEITELAVRENEFHPMKGGKFMPNKSVTDRIADATGINFIAENCTVTDKVREDEFGKRTVFVSTSQGKVRQSDGSWRPSTVEEYEFDPKLRAMEECGWDEKTPEFRRKYLEFMKVGRQRAATGSRLRVIRQLVGMPVAFDKADILRPMMFSRIVLNTDEIMSTPEGRQAAILVALGAQESIFGKEKPGPRSIEASASRVQEGASSGGLDLGGDTGTVEEPQETRHQFLRRHLSVIAQKYKDQINGGDKEEKASKRFMAVSMDEEANIAMLEDFYKRAVDHLGSLGVDYTMENP